MGVERINRQYSLVVSWFDIQFSHEMHLSDLLFCDPSLWKLNISMEGGANDFPGEGPPSSFHIILSLRIRAAAG